MRALLVSLLLASTPGICVAQVCVPTGPHTDSVTINFNLTPPAKAIRASRATDYLVLASAIKDHLAPPIAVELPDWPRTLLYSPGDNAVSNPQEFGVDGDLNFSLDTLGHLMPGATSSHTGSTLLDGELVAALRAADSAGDLAFAPAVLRGTTQPLALHVSASSMPVYQSVVFATYHSPVSFVDRLPARLKGPEPVYPRLALQGRIASSVKVRFVVDASGHVEPGSIHVISAEYQEFAESAVRAIQASTYSPGMSKGCPVRVLVQTSVVFKI